MSRTREGVRYMTHPPTPPVNTRAWDEIPSGSGVGGTGVGVGGAGVGGHSGGTTGVEQFATMA